MKNSTIPYPFGSNTPGRTFTSGSYRYGFNGVEKDDEASGSGSSYDFGNRMYDTRLGKWWSIDSKAQHYQFISPYNFAMNNPLMFVDIEGNDVIVAFTGGPTGGGKEVKVEDASSTGKIVSEAKKDALAKGVEFDGIVVAPGWTASSAVETAYNFIKENYTPGEKLILYAYSYGVDASVDLAEKLKLDGIIVDLLVTVDGSDGPLQNTTVNNSIPNNVKANLNWYQTDDSGYSSSSRAVNSSSSGSSESSSGSSSSDSGTSNSPGSNGGPNVAQDPSKTVLINGDLSSPVINHANIDDKTQPYSTKLINSVIGTGIKKSPPKPSAPVDIMPKIEMKKDNTNVGTGTGF